MENEILFRGKYMNNEEIELKPCPFCGGKAKLKHGFPRTQKKRDYQALIQCTKCGCRTPISHQVPFEPKWEVDYSVVSLWKKIFWCSECRCTVELPHYAWNCYYDYCPNCGAKMEGSDEND